MPPRTRSSARGESAASVAATESRETSVLVTSDYDDTSAEESAKKPTKANTRKRTRTDNQDADISPKPLAKRVRGKQAKLAGFMNMPIEVFNEIAKYVHPLDLVLLARANKFFRHLLMNRSAIQIWQHALSNVPGLPPCPKKLCEPQYAALLFSKYCSMCGKQALRPMDAYLLIRLCVACRNEHLTDDTRGFAGIMATSNTIIPQKGRRVCSFALRSELKAMWAERPNPNIVGWSELNRWESEKRREFCTLNTAARPLAEFIRKLEADQDNELAARKGKREEEIESRLLALGWENGDLKMREKAAMKQWKSLVCIAKPFVERNWGSVLEQLTPLLEHNRKLRLEWEAESRYNERHFQTRVWLLESLRTLKPYARLANDKTQPETELSPNISGPGSGPGPTQPPFPPVIAPNKELWSLAAPFPYYDNFVQQDVFISLVDTDLPMDTFNLKLAGMRSTLDTLLLEWTEKLENHLIQILPFQHTAERQVNVPGDPVPELLVNGKPIQDLPLQNRQLLKADTAFSNEDGTILFYPDDFSRVFELPGSWKTRYHFRASKIAESLLAVLGYSGTTYSEMKALGPRFSCGRCSRWKCVSWRQLVKHFNTEQARWEAARNHKSVKSGKLTYIPTHDLEEIRADPAARMANDEDAEAPFKEQYCSARCELCSGISQDYYEQSELAEHKRGVHLIPSPDVA